MSAVTKVTALMRMPAQASTRRPAPLVLVGLGVVLFSVGPVMVAGTSVSGPVLSFWRLWMGAVLLGSLTLRQIRATGVRPDRIGWSWAVRSGLAFGVHQLFFMTAIKRTSVVDVTLLQVLLPVFVGILAAVLLGERPGLGFRLGSAVAIGGAVIVVLAGVSGPRGDPGGVALGVLNVAFFALYFVGSKQGRDHIDPVPFLFGAVVSAGLVVSAFAVVTTAPVTRIGAHDLLLAALIALVPGSLGHFVTTLSLDRVSANVPPVMQLATPFLAGGMAWIILGQPITWLHAVGGAFTIAGVLAALVAGRSLVDLGADPSLD